MQSIVDDNIGYGRLTAPVRASRPLALQGERPGIGLAIVRCAVTHARSQRAGQQRCRVCMCHRSGLTRDELWLRLGAAGAPATGGLAAVFGQ